MEIIKARTVKSGDKKKANRPKVETSAQTIPGMERVPIKRKKKSGKR